MRILQIMNSHGIIIHSSSYEKNDGDLEGCLEYFLWSHDNITYKIFTQSILEDDQFLIDNSEGVVEVEAQILRNVLVQKLKTERELKKLKEDFAKLAETLKYHQEAEFRQKCLQARKKFVDISRYAKEV